MQYTKLPQNISNGLKTDQMVIKYTNIFHCNTLPTKFTQNGHFWSENMPSGNPGGRPINQLIRADCFQTPLFVFALLGQKSQLSLMVVKAFLSFVFQLKAVGVGLKLKAKV
jgi:hypothetical protein